jgi:hypothetical protein
MQVVADNGGSALADDGGRLLFFERRLLPSWLAFVPGLLAVLVLGNGAVQLVLGNLAAAGVLAVLGLAGLLALRAVLHSRRRAIAEPLDASSALLALDLDAGVLLDGGGRVLAALDVVRVERSMQVTSSARALRVVWPGGSVVAYRGDALQPGGSIDAATRALQARGVSVTG